VGTKNEEETHIARITSHKVGVSTKVIIYEIINLTDHLGEGQNQNLLGPNH